MDCNGYSSYVLFSSDKTLCGNLEYAHHARIALTEGISQMGTEGSRFWNQVVECSYEVYVKAWAHANVYGKNSHKNPSRLDRYTERLIARANG